MWRLDKEGSVVSDMQLTTVEELEDHVADMQEDEMKELKVDIHNFLDYWPRNSKQHTIDDISHIFGMVRFDALLPQKLNLPVTDKPGSCCNNLKILTESTFFTWE